MTEKIMGLLQRAGVVVLRTLATILELVYYLLLYGLYPLWWLFGKWRIVYAQAVRSEIGYRQFVRQATKLWLLSALLVYGVTVVGVIGYFVISQGVSVVVVTVIGKFPLMLAYIHQLVGEEIIALSETLVFVCLLLIPLRFLYRKKLFLPWMGRLIDKL